MTLFSFYKIIFYLVEDVSSISNFFLNGSTYLRQCNFARGVSKKKNHTSFQRVNDEKWRGVIAYSVTRENVSRNETRVTRWNIHNTRIHNRATFIRNIDIYRPPCPLRSSLFRRGNPLADVIKLACTMPKWTEEAAEEASIKRPTKNGTPKLFE